MAKDQDTFNELLDEVAALLSAVADQQAMPDDSWKEKWAGLRARLEDCTDYAFSHYSE